jgi:predicted DNA-binding transcriptional regulator AlpA
MRVSKRNLNVSTTLVGNSHSDTFVPANPVQRKPPQRAIENGSFTDPLLTVQDVARRLNVSRDWVWDHSSRKSPRLPVIRMGDGALRYRASAIETFICERERITALRFAHR